MNRMKPPAGSFTVKYNLVHEGKETINPIVTSVQIRPDGDVDSGRWYKSHIPLIVNVNATRTRGNYLCGLAKHRISGPKIQF